MKPTRVLIQVNLGDLTYSPADLTDELSAHPDYDFSARGLSASCSCKRRALISGILAGTKQEAPGGSHSILVDIAGKRRSFIQYRRDLHAMLACMHTNTGAQESHRARRCLDHTRQNAAYENGSLRKWPACKPGRWSIGTNCNDQIIAAATRMISGVADQNEALIQRRDFSFQSIDGGGNFAGLDVKCPMLSEVIRVCLNCAIQVHACRCRVSWNRRITMPAVQARSPLM